jgi:hypothetical protein
MRTRARRRSVLRHAPSPSAPFSSRCAACVRSMHCRGRRQRSSSGGSWRAVRQVLVRTSKKRRRRIHAATSFASSISRAAKPARRGRQQHLGGGLVRGSTAVALGSTDGLSKPRHGHRRHRPADHRARRRGTLGRVFNLLGEPIDGRGPVDAAERASHPPRAARVRRPQPQDRASSRPASRSSTCSARSSAAARSACSAGPASARPSSSRR